jgi:ribosome-associated toxin RatA of RatAB toxin-antitoxin module
MKDLHGTARTPVPASPERCIALFEAVEAYPSWYPDVVQEATVLEREDDGRPRRVQATLHVARGPITKDFHLVLAVVSDRRSEVKLTRVKQPGSGSEGFEATWHVTNPGGTEIGLNLVASLDVPRFLPVGGIGDAMAEGFVAAAAGQLR